VPCGIWLNLVVDKKHILPPYLIECRTKAALRHVRATILSTLRELDGTILLEGEPDDVTYPEPGASP
jgi:hypothetical protein